MGQIYNVYCDESGHLEHDHLPVMVLGAVWCPQVRKPAFWLILSASTVIQGVVSQWF